LKSFDLLDQRRKTAVSESSKNDIVSQNQNFLLTETEVLVPRLIQLLEEPASSSEKKRLWLARDARYWRTMASVEDADEETFITEEEKVNDEVDNSVASVSAENEEIEEENAAGSERSDGEVPSYRRLMISSRQAISLLLTNVKTAAKRVASSAGDKAPFVADAGGFVKKAFQTIGSLLFRKPCGDLPNDHINTSNDPTDEASLDIALDSMIRMSLMDIPIEEAVEEEDDHTLALEEDSFIVSLDMWTQEIPRETKLSSQRLEVAGVLCSLCVGPHKRLAQNIMTKWKLVPALIQRFDGLVWDPNFKEDRLPVSLRLHGEDCECTPHDDMKSQLLRLVHNYCDRDAGKQRNKIQLFSIKEQVALSWDYSTFQNGQAVPFGWEKN